jgi:hypothetical protein
MPNIVPPPYARYGGIIPPCPELPAATAEAEKYLAQAQTWLANAETAVRQTEVDLARAQALRDAAEKMLDAAWAAQHAAEQGDIYVPGTETGAHPLFTASYQNLIKQVNDARAVLKQANQAVSDAMASNEAAVKERQQMQEIVNRSQEWLTQLQDAALHCPPKPKQTANAFNPFDAPLPSLCDELRKDLKRAEAVLKALTDELATANDDAKKAEADFQGKLTAWRTNPTAGSADEAMQAFDTWQTALENLTILDWMIATVQRDIQRITAELSLCFPKTASVFPGSKGVRVGAAALVLGGLAAVAVLLMGGSSHASSHAAQRHVDSRASSEVAVVGAGPVTGVVPVPVTSPTPSPSEEATSGAAGNSTVSSVRGSARSTGVAVVTGGTGHPTQAVGSSSTVVTVPVVGGFSGTTTPPTGTATTSTGSESVTTTLGPPTVTGAESSTGTGDSSGGTTSTGTTSSDSGSTSDGGGSGTSSSGSGTSSGSSGTGTTPVRYVPPSIPSGNPAPASDNPSNG